MRCMIFYIVDGRVSGFTVGCNVCEGVQRHGFYWEVASHYGYELMHCFFFL